jgi:hypothetical protein
MLKMRLSKAVFLLLGLIAGCSDPANSPSARATRLYATGICNALRSGIVDKESFNGYIRNYVLKEDPGLAKLNVWDEATFTTGNHLAATKVCPELIPADSVWKRRDFWGHKFDGTKR